MVARTKPRFRSAPLAAFVAMALLGAPAARAQVNVEPLREQVSDDGFGARVRASVSSYAGNTRGIIFGGSALFGADLRRNVAYLVLTGDYAKLNGAISVAKWFAHARYNYELRRWLWWEVYGQIESDRFRRVTLRELLGTGPRFALLRSENVDIFYGASYMYERTNLDTASRGSRGEGVAHRFSNYAALTLRMHDRISVTSVTYAQPRFDEPSDVTLLSVNGADFEVTELLHSRIDLTVRYDSVTPADVAAADLELKSSLEATF